MKTPLVGRRPVVLICVEYYQPGFKAGGPLRSVAAIVEELGHEFDFFILTRDRDQAEPNPYPAIRADSWVPVGNARVFYSSPANLGFHKMVRLIRALDPDAVHLNGYFGPMAVRVLAAKRIGLLKVPVLIGPRGEFGEGALRLKYLKKSAYLSFSRMSGLHAAHRGVSWHASTRFDADDIARAAGPDSVVFVAPEIIRQTEPRPTVAKEAGSLRLMFASRITAKKNLAFLLRVLQRVRGTIALGIYGPIQEGDYWDHCRRLMDALPGHVQASYEGPIPHDALQEKLESCHFLALPTLSENFGHVIAESMLVGRPVIISDATPWRQLAAARAGWDLPVHQTAEDTWRDVIDQCVRMDDVGYREMARSANAHAKRWISGSDARRLHREMYSKVSHTA